jgi:hypothetical protein
LFTGWRGVLLALFCLAMVAVGCAEIFAMAGHYGLLGNAQVGRIGIGYQLERNSTDWLVIDRVDRGGSAERAGIVVGDRVRFADPLMMVSNPPPGTIASLTVRHAGRDRPLRVQVQAFMPTDQQFWLRVMLTTIGGNVFALLLGALVLWRGWGSLPALALGLGLVGGTTGDTLPWWMLGSPATPLWLATIVICGLCQFGLVLFPILLYRAHVAALRRGWWIAIVLVVGLAGTNDILLAGELWFAWPEPAPLRLAGTAATVASVAMTSWWTWRGLRDSHGSERSRFSILLFACGLFLSGCLLWILQTNGLDLFGPAAGPWLGAANLLLLQIAMPLALAYAVLRHRVIDLGFAFNRTLIYGSFSAILLGCFGLIEWGVEHLLPEDWVKASAWIDAGAAVLVYLAFHRVHGAVEQRVEQVFFGQWQRNEEALRRFVGSAAYFEDTRALARAFADELARFGGGARVAVYRRNDGALDRVGGTWDTAPRHFREDDPAFALMRAERAPLDLDATRTDLPGVLALPMLDHGVLAGLVLLDLKGNGALYRPDEVALLGWAAHEVGLALAALHAGLIETENRLLKAQLARIGSIIGNRLDTVSVV